MQLSTAHQKKKKKDQSSNVTFPQMKVIKQMAENSFDLLIMK